VEATVAARNWPHAVKFEGYDACIHLDVSTHTERQAAIQ
jgi:hypothetical protein